MRGGMGAAVVAVALAGAAQAQPVPPGAGRFVMGPPEANAAPGSEALAKKGDAVLVRRLFAETAVRLSQDIPGPGGAARGKPAEPWAVTGLVLTPIAAGIYCGEAKMRGLLLGARCLVDADGDGRFERAQPMICSDGPYAGWLMKPGGPVCALLADPLGRPFDLAAPAPYARADPATEAPQAWLNLRFESNYDKARAQRPVKVTLKWVAAMKPGYTGSIHNGREWTFDLPPGGVGSLMLDGGGVIDTLGFTPDGRMRYRIAAEPPGGPIDIWPWRTARTITVYLP